VPRVLSVRNGGTRSVDVVRTDHRARRSQGWTVFRHPWAWCLMVAETFVLVRSAPRLLRLIVQRISRPVA
jgi:hypothetical protein